MNLTNSGLHKATLPSCEKRTRLLSAVPFPPNGMLNALPTIPRPNHWPFLPSFHRTGVNADLPDLTVHLTNSPPLTPLHCPAVHSSQTTRRDKNRCPAPYNSVTSLRLSTLLREHHHHLPICSVQPLPPTSTLTQPLASTPPQPHPRFMAPLLALFTPTPPPPART